MNTRRRYSPLNMPEGANPRPSECGTHHPVPLYKAIEPKCQKDELQNVDGTKQLQL